MTSFIEFYKRHENEKWDYYHLSGNPQVSLLNLEELKYINYASLSKNPNITMEYVINEIKKWDNTTDWCYQNLSSNSSITIEDVKNYKLPWNYYSLSKNPNIFTYDYKLIKETMKKSGIAEELMSFIFHPKNMNKWKDWGFLEHEEFMNFIN
jgi:hypothetical protein